MASTLIKMISGKEKPMQIDKNQILELLRSQGDQDKAAQAESELPDQVDTEQHVGLLSKLGINPAELLSRLPGGLGDKLPGGLGDKLGGLGL
ncbi:hypothetical protein [Arthrobacter sp. SAFR-044]|uniref:hypothetical protein n=1 Tax=Arthrobacter sp. SAFR-044 TaxID=3387278 RepID=UPI003F7C1D3C